MSFEHLRASVDKYYSEKIREFGPTAKGVDWNSGESQAVRFDRLLFVCDLSAPFSINDFGCGYGALVDYMRQRGVSFQYCGFDLSAAMIEHAESIYGGTPHCAFTCDRSQLTAADYTVASGLVNVKLHAGDEEWKSYMLETVDELAKLSSKGFAFNALTLYSDREKMRPDLHYADPLFWFDHCKRRYSRFVTLLHDYPLYEFTIIVRK
jgi:SAM-dependent methyltransferase